MKLRPEDKAALLAAADRLEQFVCRDPQPLLDWQSPGPLFVHTVTLGGATLTLRMELCPWQILSRAQRLRKTAETDFSTDNALDALRGARARPSPDWTGRRAQFSKRIYQDFIDAGELENAESYRGLYE